PVGPSFSTALNATTAAIGGTYYVELIHTGAAGTCTLASPVVVTTISTIPVTITASSQSVCPCSAVNLTATSQQTANNSYQWTLPVGPPVLGKTLTPSPCAASVYTVDVTFYGCTGNQTMSIGMSTITPTI